MNKQRLRLWFIPYVTAQIVSMVEMERFGLWAGIVIVIALTVSGFSLFAFLLDRYWIRKHD